MPAECRSCGTDIGTWRRLRGETLCEDCERRQDADRERAIVEYGSTLDGVISGAVAPSRLSEISTRTGFASSQLEQLADVALRRHLEEVLDDEYLTEDEEVLLNRAVERLGVTDERLAQLSSGLGGRFVVARTNAGRLPVVEAPAVLLKRGEIAHLEVPAHLMKEVVHREMRGRASGISIPIAKGVRFRTGGFRGKSVVVGTSLEVADEGTLTITSRRAIYKGLRKTVEIQLTKLLGVNVFNDGVQLHASGRVSAPLFRVPDGHAVAAVVNAAWQKIA